MIKPNERDLWMANWLADRGNVPTADRKAWIESCGEIITSARAQGRRGERKRCAEIAHRQASNENRLRSEEWAECAKFIARAIADIEPTERMITVCSECLKASCWQGIFMCDKARYANVIDMPMSELMELGREHPDYWEEG